LSKSLRSACAARHALLLAACGAVASFAAPGTDLLGCPGSGLVVGADGVTIDLNGHSVQSATFGVAPGIDNTGGYDRVTIEDGQISGFSVGVTLEDASRNELRGLTITGNGAGLALSESDRNEIALSEISDNGSALRVGDGVALTDGSDRNSLTEVEIVGNQGTGVRITSSSDNVIADSVIAGHVAPGVDALDSPRTAIRGNTIESPFVAVSLRESNRSEVVGNEMTGSGFVRESSDVRIVRNSVGSISLDGGEDTTIRENTVGPVFDDGIQVGAAALDTRVVDNVSNGNFGDGIDVEASGTLIRGNTANGNFELGIRAVAGVVDGGGNSASGNGDPRQCVNVSCQ
jgi:parallel beta-helix repeat protein